MVTSDCILTFGLKPGQAARVKQTAVSASLPTPHSQFKHVPGDDGGDGSNPLIIAHTQTTFTCGCDGCGKTFQLKSSVDRHQYKDHGREKHGNRRPDDGGEDEYVDGQISWNLWTMKLDPQLYTVPSYQ